MKRILSLLLALTLLIASGCGSTAGNNEQPDNTPTNNVQTDDTTDVTPPDDTVDEGADNSADTGENTPEPDNTPKGDYNPIETGFSVGDTIADFTMKTFDGKEVTLSDVLAEKDAVLINIFATWCGPCKSEFPFMEQAYQQFKDRVEIIALSGDSSDNTEKVRQVANSLGLTFPMGLDTVGISRGINLKAYPTTLIVDRFGTIVYFHIGSFPDLESFVSFFDFLVCDEYTESVVLDTTPPMMPHLDLLSSDAISEALGGGLVFDNAPGLYNWPMSLAEVDGRSALVSTNQGMGRSRSAVRTTVTVAAGDVFAFDLKVSSEAGYDFFQLSVNGEVVKLFSGEKDWTSYAYGFPADGEYLIELAFAKDEATDSGNDTLWLDNTRLLSGDEAAAALAANPSYPTAAETTFTIANKNVQKVFFEDPYGIVYKIFGGPYEAYILNELEANCIFTLAEGVDPEAAVCIDNHNIAYILTSIVSGDSYKVSFAVDSIETTGKGHTYVTLDPNVLVDGDEQSIVFFANQEGLEKFAKTFAAGAWCNAEDLESAPWYKAEEPQSDVTYTLRCVDEAGAPVAGVTLQICNDSTCSVYTTDANGECVLTLPADNYEIHVLKAPDGFVVDPDAIIQAPIEGGEVAISLKRA